MIITILFYFFAFILLLSALRVITAAHPVQSALFLTLAFFNAAAIWMLLQAEFLAMLLVLVYVGAVMVFFLFVVMMLDIKHLSQKNKNSRQSQSFRRFVPLAATIGILMMIETGLILWHSFRTIPSTQYTGAPTHTNHSNAQALGKLIYTHYIFAFEIAGFVLLVAIIASIALAQCRHKDRKYLQATQQIRIRREDRVRIIKC